MENQIAKRERNEPRASGTSHASDLSTQEQLQCEDYHCRQELGTP